MTTYDQIFENNRQWVANKLEKDASFFDKLAQGQQPDFLYIGCSDSRVPANDIMGLEAGEVFVHRNVANVVSNTDINAASVINYAVKHLKVKHVIVCGHYSCGGVKAAMQSDDLGTLNPWLRNIRDVYRLHQSELEAISDGEERYNRLVELNVIEQCINVIKTEVVQEMYVSTGFPKVHGWVFGLKDGMLKDLGFNFEERMKSIQHIYTQTVVDWFEGDHSNKA